MQRQPLTILFIALILVTVSACTLKLSERPVVDDKGSRTLGTIYNDQLIETTAIDHARRASVMLQDAHFNVTSFNSIVLITGQVPSENTKTLVGAKTQLISNVRKVHNELIVSNPISLAESANDLLITTKIIASMLAENNFPASRIKVITENGVVYLMGLVTRTEGDWAVNLVRRSSGIQKIVKVFEYIN
jgi:osmotically-inducible protein OsmY